MKFTLAGLLVATSLAAAAETEYRMPDVFSEQGYVQLYWSDKGLRVKYPDHFKAPVRVFDSYDSLASREHCDLASRYGIQQYKNASSTGERQQVYDKYLKLQTPARMRVSYFPYKQPSFQRRLEDFLSKQGIDQVHVQYREARPEVRNLKVKASQQQAWSAQIPEVEGQYHIDHQPGAVFEVVTHFLPLACDMAKGDITVSYDWSLRAELFNPDYREDLSRAQVDQVYDGVKSYQDLVGGQSSLNTNQRMKTILQGAILGSQFEKYVKDLDENSIAVLRKVYGQLYDLQSGGLRSLNPEDLDRVHRRLMVDVSVPYIQEGSAYVHQ